MILFWAGELRSLTPHVVAARKKDVLKRKIPAARKGRSRKYHPLSASNHPQLFQREIQHHVAERRQRSRPCRCRHQLPTLRSNLEFHRAKVPACTRGGGVISVFLCTFCASNIRMHVFPFKKRFDRLPFSRYPTNPRQSPYCHSAKRVIQSEQDNAHLEHFAFCLQSIQSSPAHAYKISISSNHCACSCAVFRA